MAKQTRDHLTGEFANNQMPDGDDFKDLIESGINQQDDNIHVDSSQQVGIGTDNPEAKLHVSGSAKIEGTATITGDLTVENSNITLGQKLTAQEVDADSGSIDTFNATTVTASGAASADSLSVTRNVSTGSAAVTDDLRCR